MLKTHDAALAMYLVVLHRALEIHLGEPFQSTLQSLQENLKADDLTPALRVIEAMKNLSPEPDHVLQKIAQDFLRDYSLDDFFPSL